MRVGVLSAVDAATNDLASLISRLDLEATPGTPRGTLRLSPSFTNLLAESPRLKRSPKKNGSLMTLPIHPNKTSRTSLRPSPQSQIREDSLHTQPFSQQIAPWPTSPPGAPPPVSSTHGDADADTSSACERSAAQSEYSFDFRPLWPTKAKKTSQPKIVAPVAQFLGRSSTVATTNVPAKPPPIKFRSMSKKSVGPLTDSRKESPLSHTFRKVMSTLSLSANKEVELGVSPDSTGVPISKGAQKDLGLAGTLGGSMSSRNLDRSMDLDGPDSDIPNELQVILTGGDTFTSFPPSHPRRPPSPGLPPKSPLPIPALQTSVTPSDRRMVSVPWKDEVQLEDHDESDSSSLEENDTRKSFDFTSELKSLSESAGSHRHSFVEQLENAFRTPAKYDLDGYGHFGPEDVPPMPSIPHPASRRHFSNESCDPNAAFSNPVLPLLPSPEIIVSKKLTNASSSHDLSQGRLQQSSASPKPSYGQLDLNFKFGLSTEVAERSQLTLSDIIPSPACARSLSMVSLQDDAQQPAVPQPTSAPSSYPSARRRVNSDSSSRHSIYGDSRMDACSLHSRASSQISFKGLESFDEIRRGFEFVENRPAFYPPPSFSHRRDQMPRDSLISIASVSSYGMIINPGVKDPFDYGYQSRPASSDMSAFMTMSTSVDDTFSFMRRCPRRKRVDSDSSSFYFRAPGTSRIPRPLKGQFHRDSIISTALAPPVSIYNRSFGVHRGIDSASGASSGAHAACGLAGGDRSSWAPSHRRELSADSVISDVSVRVPRPTLGDKMLDSKHDYCLPLSSIAASPPESVTSNYLNQRVRSRGSFDSIMDDERRSYSRDSIMDQSNCRTSTTSESVFGQDGSHSMHSPLGQFRIYDDPTFSLFGAEGDSADPKREDDTMISVGVLLQNLNLIIMYFTQMIGGGRVRRRSVSSFVEGSPIFVRVGKRKAVVARPQRHVQQCEEVVESPNGAQKVESSPSGLGEERMMTAREGLLSRDSLEEHCLCADGVDTSCEWFGFVSPCNLLSDSLVMTEPVFSRPVPASRSRSGTHSSTSSDLDTPSLSSSGETSSVASDSISSIDLSRVNLSLTNMSYPIIMQSRTRVRSKGHGHRRRLSGIQLSRRSVYETIEEENHTSVTDGFPDSVKAALSPVVDDSVIIVDPDDVSTSEWDERGVVALRKYYTLKDEADVTIKESKQSWLDTPFSIYAVQCMSHLISGGLLLTRFTAFEPPAHRSGMRALLEHSRQTYGPLSAELRRIRSRTSSRPSPYPQPQRTVKISLSPLTAGPEICTIVAPKPAPSTSPAPISAPQALQQRTVNVNTVAAEVSSLMPGKIVKGDSGSLSQSRSGSGTRRSMLGWAKRGIGKENQEKDLCSRAMTAYVP
jgi:serine/arginine repetitive matrix protein 2